MCDKCHKTEVYCSQLCKLCYQNKWRHENPEMANAANRRYKKRLKDRVIKGYGGKCVCCGESNNGFLTLDHVNEDGAEERKQFGHNTQKLHNRIIREGFPSRYQLLCYNCNCGRAYNGGVCPHGDEKE